MKQWTATLFLMAALLILAACGGNAAGPSPSASPETTPSSKVLQTEEPLPAPDAPQKPDEDNEAKHILIAYFSRAGENYNVGYIEKGSTQVMAEMIAEQTGGILFQIQTVNPYPEGYEECKEVAQKEKDDGARPALIGHVESMDGYDVILLGYPIWMGDMPMAMYTFLESHDFSGKTIVPFCTHEGSGLSDTVQSISAACSGAEILEGLAIRGKTAQESQDEAREAVMRWLHKNGFAG